MAISEDDRKRVEAILLKARQPDEERAESGETDSAEIMAAIADGVLRFDEIPEEAMGHAVRQFGADAVGEAFARARPQRSRERWRTPWLPVWAAVAAALVLAVWLAPWRRTAPAPVSAVAQFPSGEAPLVSGDGLRALSLPMGSGSLTFQRSGGTAGGSAHLSRIGRWPLATAIVRFGNSWGSGAFISADGYLLTNYHVVEEAAQQAAVRGDVAQFDVITPRVAGNQLEPREAVPAQLYRADPIHDLALLKIERFPDGLTSVPAYRFGETIQVRNDCHAIGSKGGGRAWQIDDGKVNSRFQYPAGLTAHVIGMARPEDDRDRMNLTAIETTASIAPGDSGGPLLNEQGQLVGLTFGTPNNASAARFGWHVDLPYLTEMVKNLPVRAEGVPFDIWTAGLSEVYLAKPVLGDEDHDGKVDTLQYRYFGKEANGSSELQAFTIFVDFEERLGSVTAPPALGMLPFGIWGRDDRGRFRFDVLLMARKDGLNAAGYTDARGVVSEIRLGQSGDAGAKLIWVRDAAGRWRVEHAGAGVPIIDAGRLGAEKMARLRVLAAELLGHKEGAR